MKIIPEKTKYSIINNGFNFWYFRCNECEGTLPSKNKNNDLSKLVHKEGCTAVTTSDSMRKEMEKKHE